MSDTDVHTCHSECPCQTGGEPPKDFLSIEGSLLRRGNAAYDEALRHALAIRAVMAEHRRGKPMAFPTSPRDGGES